jgi:3-hydroxyisobutyrate dehydrogenase
MGEPMALNLARAGHRVLAWNRSPREFSGLRCAGVEIVATANEVISRAQTIIMMLANEEAADQALNRSGAEFGVNVAGRTFVHMGTTSEVYSRELEAAICSSGGFYVEAPVSGSRAPAEQGRLVAMLAGQVGVVSRIRPVLAPLCRELVFCGQVPNALLMKLAVNAFLISMVTGLAEAFHFAERKGLDIATFVTLINKSPMASEVSQAKASKLATAEYSPHAKISDVLMNNRLITSSATASNIAMPLLEECIGLYSEAVGLGLGMNDMCAVVKAIEARHGAEMERYIRLSSVDDIRG